MLDEATLAVVYKNAREGNECQDRVKRVIELGRKLMQCLGSNKSTFLEYENAVILLNSAYLEKAYVLGLGEGKP